jgi:uncharacterized protein (DUF488 family)
VTKVDNINGGGDRVFHIGDRFIIKSHREGGGYACILCSKLRGEDTVTNGVASLVEHIWLDHSVEEYEKDVDIREFHVKELSITKAPSSRARSTVRSETVRHEQRRRSR